MSVLEVRNYFIKSRVTVKSSDPLWSPNIVDLVLGKHPQICRVTHRHCLHLPLLRVHFLPKLSNRCSLLLSTSTPAVYFSELDSPACCADGRSLTMSAFALTPIIYHNCDSATIRRYHGAFDYNESDRNYDMRSIRLRYDQGCQQYW